MARFEDTPELFGLGVGSGTDGNIICEWCKTAYKNREYRDGRPKSHDEAIRFTNFGNLTVCDCCFEEVENAVLARMDDIIPWYIRMLQARRLKIEERERMIAVLRKALEG